MCEKTCEENSTGSAYVEARSELTYQVGDIRNLSADDPELRDLATAERDALVLSRKSTDSFIGVWTGQIQGSELLAICYDGEIFRAR